jgi:8-oxo-dGTP pyrophosphatase MutT (NUDIX family)
MEEPWRRGAVLLPILGSPPHGVLFVERALHLRRHPGQIGLPGGIVDPVDEGDPEQTALRELREEVGVAAERVTIVGRLPDVEQNLNRFVITPVVGTLDPQTRFSVDGEEIVGVFVVPLAEVVADGAVYIDVEASEARGKPMYALDFEGHHIWGFTGRVLKSFVDAWNAPKSRLRSAIEARGVNLH